MIRTLLQALAWCLSMRGSRSYNGLCLKYTRNAFNVAAHFPGAIDAWNGAARRHGSITTAPDGAPVYLSHPKSRWGHVAVLRRVGGVAHIETTNSALGRTALQPLSLWVNGYGYKVLGWTEDLNGVHVASPITTGGAVLRRGHTGPRVGALQRAMNRVFPAYSRLAVDEIFGPATEAVVREFQRRAGLLMDGVVGPATTAALARYGVRL